MATRARNGRGAVAATAASGRRPPPSEFSEAVRLYHEAAGPLLFDPRIWEEESARANAPRLTRPRSRGTQFGRLLAVLANADIDVLLALLKFDDDPRSPAWPPCDDDPKLQVLLRVVQRSQAAGEAALVAAFGGERITGRRHYVNQVNEQAVTHALQLARRHGLTRDQAFELLALPRRQAFRAAARAATRKK
jgi:hypothetical protein